MPFARTRIAATVSLLVLLQGCVQTPPREEAPTPEEVPELTLNLPQANGCVCEEPTTADYTFLEKGFAALAAGEHIEAVQYFQRYQRLEESPEAQWEAGIAIAFVSTLSHGPFYDPEAARQAFRKLRREDWKDMELHQQSLLMRHSLEAFVTQERHVLDLESTNATLKEDLEKREEALKRLRELTLGQKAAPP
jgi:hypothetical protein